MLRARITPTVDAQGAACVKIEWVEIHEGMIHGVRHVEEFRVLPNRFGCSLISSVEVSEATVNEGRSLWVDENGKRHFRMKAEGGRIERASLTQE